MLKVKGIQDQITDIRGQEQELMAQQIQNPSMLGFMEVVGM